mgnify:CR=1 FL=1
MDETNFSSTLLSWYDRHKRDLPWRKTNNPYSVWLSEIILQQTRVNQGLSYYQKFLKHYPTVQHLAEAPQDKILKDWEGLGYYSRARNLHQAAQHIVKHHQGKFPNTYREILKLKGVGPYTAAAIASFSYGEVTPVIDGNVQRVLSRIWGIHLPVNEAAGQKAIQEKAEQLIDPQHPDIYNQAIMEFGALQCVPKNPHCGECPFGESCIAFRQKNVAQLPIKNKVKYNRKRYLHYFYLRKQKQICLSKRDDRGIWKGLYEWPCIEEGSAQMGEAAVKEYFEAQNAGSLEENVLEKVTLKPHKLSHQTLYITIWVMQYSAPIHRHLIPAHSIWVNEEDIHKFAFPRPLRKFLDRDHVPLPFGSKSNN